MRTTKRKNPLATTRTAHELTNLQLKAYKVQWPQRARIRILMRARCGFSTYILAAGVGLSILHSCGGRGDYGSRCPC